MTPHTLAASLILAFSFLCASLPAQSADESEVARLYQSYQRYVAQKSWIPAYNIGNAIVRKYPGSDTAKKVATELPEISKRAEAAHKADEARKAQEAEKQKQLEATQRKREAEYKALQKRAVANLRRDRDEVEHITFYTAPSTPKNVANNWHLYIAMPDKGRPYLRFKWMYTSDDWLFIRKITLSVDGNKLGSVPMNFFSVKRDNGYGQIWEWQDEGVRDADVSFFKMLANSKKTIIRYEGDKYYKDRTLSESEKKAFIQVLAAYEVMKAK